MSPCSSAGNSGGGVPFYIQSLLVSRFLLKIVNMGKFKVEKYKRKLGRQIVKSRD